MAHPRHHPVATVDLQINGLHASSTSRWSRREAALLATTTVTSPPCPTNRGRRGIRDTETGRVAQAGSDDDGGFFPVHRRAADSKAPLRHGVDHFAAQLSLSLRSLISCRGRAPSLWDEGMRCLFIYLSERENLLPRSSGRGRIDQNPNKLVGRNKFATDAS